MLNGFNSPVNQHMVTIPMENKQLCEEARETLSNSKRGNFYTVCLRAKNV